MKTIFQFNDLEYTADLRSAVSIARMAVIEDADFEIRSIEIQRTPFVDGEFVGAVSAGGSCNVDVLKINPHCATTHTETLLHILDREKWPLEKVSIAAIKVPTFIPSLLVSVSTVPATEAVQCGETYFPEMQTADRVITAESLTQAIKDLGFDLTQLNCPFAVVIRTTGESLWSFRSADPVPYLTREAMALISQSQCQHLLVDLPSVDRRNDKGVLSNHHSFWNVQSDQPDSNRCRNLKSRSVGAELPASYRVDRTITEMVSVPSRLGDGVYLLDLQTVPLNTDATLSRPVLIAAVLN